MATSSASANHGSLAVLSETVNQTLVDTGRFFRSSGSMQSRSQLKAALPSAYDNFQLALDNLSEQIFIAKAFLEREYETIKAKKAVSPSPDPTTAPSESKPAEDVTMAEAPSTSVNIAAQDATERARFSDKTEQSETVPVEIKTETEGKAGGSAPAANHSPEEGSEEAQKQREDTKMGDQTLPQTEELSFDSLLPVGADGANDFDLNLNFANDDIGNQNFLAGTSFLDSGAGGVNADGSSHDQSRDQQGSISSLLPGLESYAANNGGEDFHLELEKLNHDAGQQSDGQKNTAQDDVMGPGESSFDDLFVGKDNLGGDGDDNLFGDDGLMDIGELDDAWFN